MTRNCKNKVAGGTQRQCAKCPWKVDTDPLGIPDGYDVAKHAALRNTIAESNAFLTGDVFRVMACHETPVGAERPCVGWLHNQLGVGNNIGLRLAVHQGAINGDYEIVGEQHERFEDTLPRTRRRRR